MVKVIFLCCKFTDNKMIYMLKEMQVDMKSIKTIQEEHT